MLFFITIYNMKWAAVLCAAHAQCNAYIVLHIRTRSHELSTTACTIQLQKIILFYYLFVCFDGLIEFTVITLLPLLLADGVLFSPY